MLKRVISLFVCLCFLLSNLQYVHAQDFSVNQLPVPGTMIGESAPFAPLALKGVIVNPQKPLEFQFIVDTGKGPQDNVSIKEEANQLIKYFLAGLTIPEGDLWVNLSPYEKNRMVPEALGQTDLGRDLLAQDYILKQLTASLIYPEKDLGKEFWSRVYAKAQQQFGTTNVPVNTFNKVWILPDQAQVYENGNAAYVTKATLKVMLDEDYTALQKHMFNNSLPLEGRVREGGDNSHSIASQIVREIVLPEITKEVNTGKNFAPLRQIYQALILAKWYKETIQNGLLDAVYTDKNKVAGVNVNDPTIKEKIYNRYLQAYKKGAFNYVKDDSTPDGQVMPRKYFSGGTNFSDIILGKIYGQKAMLSVLKKLMIVGGSLLLLVASCSKTDLGNKQDAQSIPPTVSQQGQFDNDIQNSLESLKKPGSSPEDQQAVEKVIGELVRRIKQTPENVFNNSLPTFMDSDGKQRDTIFLKTETPNRYLLLSSSRLFTESKKVIMASFNEPTKMMSVPSGAISVVGVNIPYETLIIPEEVVGSESDGKLFNYVSFNTVDELLPQVDAFRILANFPAYNMSVAPLIKLLDDDDYRVRLAAVGALQLNPSPDSIDPLIRKLSDPNAHVRIAAILALGYEPFMTMRCIGFEYNYGFLHVGNQRIINALIGVINNAADIYEKRIALQTLASVGNEGTLQILKNYLPQSGELSSWVTSAINQLEARNSNKQIIDTNHDQMNYDLNALQKRSEQDLIRSVLENNGSKTQAMIVPIALGLVAAGAIAAAGYGLMKVNKSHSKPKDENGSQSEQSSNSSEGLGQGPTPSDAYTSWDSQGGGVGPTPGDNQNEAMNSETEKAVIDEIGRAYFGNRGHYESVKGAFAQTLPALTGQELFMRPVEPEEMARIKNEFESFNGWGIDGKPIVLADQAKDELLAKYKNEKLYAWYLEFGKETGYVFIGGLGGAFFLGRLKQPLKNSGNTPAMSNQNAAMAGISAVDVAKHLLQNSIVGETKDGLGENVVKKGVRGEFDIKSEDGKVFTFTLDRPNKNWFLLKVFRDGEEQGYFDFHNGFVDYSQDGWRYEDPAIKIYDREYKNLGTSMVLISRAIHQELGIETMSIFGSRANDFWLRAFTAPLSIRISPRQEKLIEAPIMSDISGDKIQFNVSANKDAISNIYYGANGEIKLTGQAAIDRIKAVGRAQRGFAQEGLSYKDLDLIREKDEGAGFISKREFNWARVRRQVDLIEENLLKLDAHHKKIDADDIISFIEKDPSKYFKGEEVHILNGTGSNAKVIGRIDRGIAEAFGYIHETANIVFITPDGKKVLLQLRNKKNYDDHLAMYGGHLGVGESHPSGAREEALQETGLEELHNELVPIGFEAYDRRIDGDNNVERRSWFVYRLDNEEYEKIKARVAYIENVLDIGVKKNTREEYKAALFKAQAGIIQEPFLIRAGLSDEVFSLLKSKEIIRNITNKEFDKLLGMVKKDKIKALLAAERSNMGAMFKLASDDFETKVQEFFPENFQQVNDFLRLFKSGSGEVVGIEEIDLNVLNRAQVDENNPESPYKSADRTNGFLMLGPTFKDQTEPLKAYFTPDGLDHLLSTGTLWADVKKAAENIKTKTSVPVSNGKMGRSLFWLHYFPKEENAKINWVEPGLQGSHSGNILRVELKNNDIQVWIHGKDSYELLTSPIPLASGPRGETVHSIAGISPDGSYFVTTTSNREACVWFRNANGEWLYYIINHFPPKQIRLHDSDGSYWTNAIPEIQFSPNSELLRLGKDITSIYSFRVEKAMSNTLLQNKTPNQNAAMAGLKDVWIRFKNREIIYKLESPDGKVRLAAVNELAKLGKPSMIILLELLQEDPDVSVRHQSALHLADIGDKTILPDLISVLETEPEKYVRNQVVLTIASIGGPAVLPEIQKYIDAEYGPGRVIFRNTTDGTPAMIVEETPLSSSNIPSEIINKYEKRFGTVYVYHNQIYVDAYESGGDATGFERALVYDHDVNTQENITKMIEAAYQGDLNSVQMGLDSGVDIDAPHPANGWTALMSACAGGHKKIVKLLQDYRADVNARMTDGATALMIASANGHGDIVEQLIDKERFDRIDLDAKDRWGRTALMVAREEDKQGIADQLIAAGAKDQAITSAPIQNEASHQYAALNVTPVAAVKDAKAESELIAAIKDQDKERVQELLAQGVSPNATDAEGQSALYWANTHEIYARDDGLNGSPIFKHIDAQEIVRIIEGAIAKNNAMSNKQIKSAPHNAAMIFFPKTRVSMMRDIKKLKALLNDPDVGVRKAVMYRLGQLSQTGPEILTDALSNIHSDVRLWAMTEAGLTSTPPSWDGTDGEVRGNYKWEANTYWHQEAGIDYPPQGGNWRRINFAMLPTPAQHHKVPSINQLENGGIDLNQINVLRNGKKVNVRFDPAQLDQLQKGGFAGFTFKIESMSRISSPFQLLGVITPPEKHQLLAKA